MALQMRLVQKAGVISLSSGVTLALQEGWQLYGSPFVTSNAATQVMFLPDDAAPAPSAEYHMVSKDGQTSVSAQIIAMLADGWKLFGEPLETQYGTTQAMTRGEFTVFMPDMGFGEGTPGGVPGITENEVKNLIAEAIASLPEQVDWQPALDEQADTIRDEFAAADAEVMKNADKNIKAAVAAHDEAITKKLADIAQSTTEEIGEAITGALIVAAGHADDGDTNVMRAATEYADGVGDEVYVRTQVARRQGSKTTPTVLPGAVFAAVASDAGTSRSVFELPPVAGLPDGYHLQIMNCTGVEESSEWSSSVRVHCNVDDYPDGYLMHGTKGTSSNSVVMMPVTLLLSLVLDKTKKLWFYAGTGAVPNAFQAPAGRDPLGDLPE